MLVNYDICYVFHSPQDFDPVKRVKTVKMHHLIDLKPHII